MSRESAHACGLLSVRAPAWAVAVILAVVFAAYAPVFRNGFVWDDDSSLTANRFIQDNGGFRQIWLTTRTPDYWPVTSTALWLEWRLWGANPLGYHVASVLVHAMAAVLFWMILTGMGVPGAFLAALIFAVHPVNVESVAWITQLKNLLAMLFFLASIYCFLRSRSGLFYALSLVAFILAMLSKGSAAPLPLVLLGLSAWDHRPTAGDMLRLVPFAVVAAALAAVDVWFQRHGTGEAIRHASLAERLLGAGAVPWFYLGKAVAPVGLLFVYPQWVIRPSSFGWWLPLAAGAGATAALLRAGPRGRPVLAAWGYFCAMLLPVMGFSDVYFMRFSLVADHYQYFAMVGVIALAAAGWTRFSDRWQWGQASDTDAPRRHTNFRGLTPYLTRDLIPCLVVCVLGILTWRQCLLYRDSETLFRATLQGNSGCWMADTNLGSLLADQGHPAEAAGYFERALALNPDLPQAHLDLGTVLRAMGRREEALVHFETALRLSPESPGAHFDVGIGLADARRLPEAVVRFERALELRPDYPEAENALGNALRQLGRTPEAATHLEKAIRLRPAFPEAENNLGLALAQQGRISEAIVHFERASRLGPAYLEAENNLGIALAQQGRISEAIVHFDKMVQLRPDNAQFHFNLANALAQAGRIPEATYHYEEVLRIDPAFAPAREMLSRLSAAAPQP